MDVKLSTQYARLWSLALVLVLGEASVALADEAIASDSEDTTSTIYISDDSISDDGISNDREPLSQAQMAEGSVVFIEDTPAQAPVTRSTINRATVLEPKPLEPKPVESKPMLPERSVARGELKVLSNQQRQMAALQPLAVPAEQDRPGDIQIAVHTEPIVPEITAPKSATPKAEITSVAKLLIEAHQHSLEASSASDYSQILEGCAEALRQGVTGEQRGFARQLCSWALNRRGQIHSDEHEQGLAKADFRTALDFNSRNWRAMHNRGVTLAQTGQFAEAFDDFNRVIQLNPNYAKAYANRATLYVQAKDLQAAIKDYELAIERDANFATAYVGLGRVCHMLGRWDDAIDYFTAAVELEPTSADVVCSRGDLQADMGHYGEALADYARTIELDPEFAHAYRNGAWLLATCPDERFRDPANAVLGAQQALGCSYGEQHIALDTLAAAQASNGQFEEAIATVTRAVDLAPEDAKYTYLARLQLYQDQEPFRTEPIGDVSQATYEGE